MVIFSDDNKGVLGISLTTDGSLGSIEDISILGRTDG